MDWETFAARLIDAQSRLHDLRLKYPEGDPHPDGTATHDALQIALRDLEQAFDEFVVAQDELHLQMQQLVETRRELAEQRRRYRMLFVSAPAAYLVTTPLGIILDANQQAGALLNIRPRFLIGKPLILYIARSQHVSFHERLRKLDTPGNSYDDWQLLMRPRGGGRFEASATVVCGIDPTQREAELQWLIFDATTRRREERAMQQANAELEERVADRTRELEAASRAKDDFLASLSHELRTPVNVIRGFARMLRGGQLDAEGSARAIDAIDRNAARQTRLVADLLDVSRINAGKFQLRCQQIDLRAAVSAACETATPVAQNKEIALHVSMPNAPIWVWGDGERLQQAFDNLLSNAIKFTPPRGEVEVKLVNDRSGWRISVRDNGIGIAPEFVPQLFERFRQADATSVYGGLGLGLSIVRHIIQLHGGTVTASSGGRGQGATFTCLLPAQSSQEAAVDDTSVRRASDHG